MKESKYSETFILIILPSLYVCFSYDNELPRRPGFWKFKRLLSVVELLSFKIQKFANESTIRSVTKGCNGEMIKMETRAFTVAFSKEKAKQQRDEESEMMKAPKIQLLLPPQFARIFLLAV